MSNYEVIYNKLVAEWKKSSDIVQCLQLFDEIEKLHIIDFFKAFLDLLIEYQPNNFSDKPKEKFYYANRRAVQTSHATLRFHSRAFGDKFDQLVLITDIHPDFEKSCENVLDYYSDNLSRLAEKLARMIISGIVSNRRYFKSKGLVDLLVNFIRNLEEPFMISQVFDEIDVFLVNTRRIWEGRKFSIAYHLELIIAALCFEKLQENNNLRNTWKIYENRIITIIKKLEPKSNLLPIFARLIENYGKTSGEDILLNKLIETENEDNRKALMNALGTVGTLASLPILTNISKNGTKQESELARHVLHKIAQKNGYRDHYEMLKAQQPKELTFMEIVKTVGICTSLIGVIISLFIPTFNLSPQNELIFAIVMSSIVFLLVLVIIGLLAKNRMDAIKYRKKLKKSFSKDVR